MTVARAFAAVLAAVVLAALIAPRRPLPDDVRDSIRWFAALAAAFAVLAAVAGGMRWSRPRHAARWLAGALVLFGAGAGLYMMSARAQHRCTAPYAGTTVVIGSELTPFARQYIAAGASPNPEDLVLDAAGRLETLWTSRSIAACRSALILYGSLWFPALAGSFALLLMAASAWRRGVLVPATEPVTDVQAEPQELRYDAFLSYRHSGADAEFARQLLIRLEEAGFRVAIDERDFRPEQNFVQEMERCILQSRYTLAVISRRYLESGNTEEEALISKVLTLDQRRKRLIPIIMERTQLPIWLRGTVGIDFTRTDGLIEPLEALRKALGAPLSSGAAPENRRGLQSSD